MMELSAISAPGETKDREKLKAILERTNDKLVQAKNEPAVSST